MYVSAVGKGTKQERSGSLQGAVSRVLFDLELTTSTPSILIVGDGNLSYAASLVAWNESHGNWQINIVASVLEDSEEALIKVYPSAIQSLSVIRSVNYACIQFGVDAKQLATIFCTKFDRIVFNFPQTPPCERQHRKVQYQRKLLSGFFRGAADEAVLAKGGRILVSLLAGQGGMELEGKHRRPRKGDSWQIVEQAASAGLIIVSAPFFCEQSVEYNFCSTLQSHYKAVGFRGNDEGFKLNNSRVYILERACYTVPCFFPSGGSDIKNRGAACGELPSAIQLEPPHYTFDISFWDISTIHATKKDEAFSEFAKEIAARHGVNLVVMLREEKGGESCSYIDPSSGRRTRNYKLELTAQARTALSRRAATALTDAIYAEATVAIQPYFQTRKAPSGSPI